MFNQISTSSDLYMEQTSIKLKNGHKNTKKTFWKIYVFQYGPG